MLASWAWAWKTCVFRSIGRKASQHSPSLALIELLPSPYRGKGLFGVVRVGREGELFLTLPVELNTKSIVFSPRFFQEMLHELQGCYLLSLNAC